MPATRERRRSRSSSASDKRSRSKRRKTTTTNNDKDKDKERNILRVSNLSRNVNEDHLREIFGNVGKVKEATLSIDKAVGLPTGYAHIEFSNEHEAERAIKTYHGGQIDCNVIKVEYKSDRKQRQRNEREAREKPRERSRDRRGPEQNRGREADRDKRGSGREKEREKGTERDREKEKPKEREKTNDREKERQKEKEKEKVKGKDKEKGKEKGKGKEKEKAKAERRRTRTQQRQAKRTERAEEWKLLQKEECLAKKLRRGKISASQFESNLRKATKRIIDRTGNAENESDDEDDSSDEPVHKADGKELNPAWLVPRKKRRTRKSAR
mmetsp:Transcript_91079/g.221105  ORF Transcript_91079/g.221105 Transcript_91079/m.221105 type:complete len:326 (-) Transcript_91079:59-1036(-)